MRVNLMNKATATQLRKATTQASEPAATRKVVVKYFTPDANCTWFVIEGEQLANGDWRLFGLCDLGMGSPELGYVMLSELQAVRGRMGLPVERDRHYSGTLADAAKDVGYAYL